MAHIARQIQSASTPSGTSTVDEFLNLISDPFQQQIQANSIYASIIWSFAVSGGLFFTFCFLRPRHNAVYAPRAKHADEKHAPPPLGRGFFSWLKSARGGDEQQLVERIGLDAVVFLRFIRMLRNIFLLLTVVGCGVLIPINVVGGHSLYSQWSNVATLMKFTPQYIFGQKFWAYVVLAYVLQGVVFFLIWWNYKAVLRLRLAYYHSYDYKTSLHARTLLITHLPSQFQSDSGIVDLVEQAKPTDEIPKSAIARNMKDLPELIDDHDEAVKKLESYLAKYLSEPEKISTQRPKMKLPEKERADQSTVEVDVIEYLTSKISRLEREIKEERESLDKRDVLPFGFASYSHIENAHAVAHAARAKAPHDCTIRLAPKPSDLIWKNLPMTRAVRRSRRFLDGGIMVLLTILYIPLNVVTSVFLSDFAHLGLLWPSFQKNLYAHPVGWGIAQGIIAPAVQYLWFFILPTVFRRLYHHSGDVSKTSRERHVISRLYVFFVVNNLVVFSIFGAAFRFVAAVTQAQNENVWDVIKNSHIFTNIMAGLCNISTFWLTYNMQQNLSAATDLVQLFPLLLGTIRRRFFHPTPRELIELSAPPPIDYASYYNSYLFIVTSGMCFGILQPVILPVTAVYLGLELYFKRYMVQYVLITKTESGGQFWGLLTNRLLFAALLANAVIALVVGAQGVGSHDLIGETAASAAMLYAMIPLPLLMCAFKWWLGRSFDGRMRYFSTRTVAEMDGAAAENGSAGKPRRPDKVAVKFGHPALYKPLLTPMVAAKSQHLLKEVLSESLSAPGIYGGDPSAPGGYSDVFKAEMSASEPGKAAAAAVDERFELVDEAAADFEHFKRRREFREEFGGDGELYGRPGDVLSRPGTPSTLSFGAPPKRIAAPDQSSRASSNTRVDEGEGTTYDRGYRPASSHDVDEPMGGESSRVGSIDIALPTPGLSGNDILTAVRDAADANSNKNGGDAWLLGNTHSVARKPVGSNEDTSYETYRP